MTRTPLDGLFCSDFEKTTLSQGQLVAGVHIPSRCVLTPSNAGRGCTYREKFGYTPGGAGSGSKQAGIAIPSL